MQSDKPVAVRFTPEEKAELQELSQREDRTMSSMVRIIYLIGLAHFKASRGLK
ncbi:hypothetical protein JW897_17855 [Chromobacterium alkanivorans]|uniref:hypothetical protein n=1 Tax=Chromobacterium alkanivorans TaxID=1071719 RepID=UPI0019672565|nr:hypothetical protein [Chromobacterium alkanivorans]MBN3005601.1 hypothetical protein [Chromobacterium alkanivorans]